MNQPPESNNRDSSNTNTFQTLLQKATRPSTLMFVGGTIALGVGGYIGGTFWLKQNLPTWLENQLSKTLDRPVDIGKITKLSPFELETENIIIPATENDPDYLTIPKIQAQYNLLPLLWGKPLKAEVNIINPEIYLEQDADGQWLKIPPRERGQTNQEIPIPVDVSLSLKQGEIKLLPETKTSPVLISLEGTTRYQKQQQQDLDYQWQVDIAGADLEITGTTVLETGKTALNLNLNSLNLPIVASLWGETPVNLNQGNLEAKVEANLPSISELRDTQATGEINLSGVQGTLDFSSEPITADLNLQLLGQKILVEKGNLSFGKLKGNLQGELNWQTGYNLNLDLEQVNLEEIKKLLDISLPLAGDLKANLDLIGPIEKPQLKGNLSNISTLKIDQVPIQSLEADLKANLDLIEIADLEIIPQAGGKIELNGNLQTNLQETLAQQQPLNWLLMPLLLNIKAELPVTPLVAPYTAIPEILEPGIITAQGQLQGTLENPQANLNWQTTSQSQVQTQGEVVIESQEILLKNTRIATLEGEIQLTGEGNLKTQAWQAQFSANNLNLTPLALLSGREANINLQQGKGEFEGNFQTGPETWSGQTQLQLAIEGGIANLDSNLREGQLVTQVQAREIALLPEVKLEASQVELIAAIAPLLNGNLDFSSWRGQANLNLLVNQGTLNSTTLLNQGQWQSAIAAQDVDVVALLESLNLAIPPDLILSNLNAQLNLSGELEPLFNSNPSLPLTIQRAKLSLGEQQLEAQGELILANLNTAPDIGKIDLELQTRANLATLPLNPFLQQIDAALVPEKLNLQGLLDFQGRLQGKQLLAAPLAPGNLELTGDLQLFDFNLNQTQFDPLLAGTITIAPGKNIALDLRGEEDAIALGLEPCLTDNCRLPYLPTNLELKQGRGSEAILVEGTRKGERFLTTIHNFPLSIFNITPATDWGIPGAITGQVAAQLDINLFNFATEGELTVQEPALGHIKAKSFNTQFSYDVASQEAEIITSSFNFQESQYQLEAKINLDNGAIEGKVNLGPSKLQDIFTTLQWSNLDDVLRFLEQPVYAKAQDIQTKTVGNPEDTFAEQINLWWQIRQQLRAFKAKVAAGQLPLALDLRGEYDGEILLAGTLQNPQVDFEITGDKWQWRTKPPALDVVNPIGLVWELEEVIPINDFVLEGQFAEGVVAIENLNLKLREMELKVDGPLFQEEESLNFSITNLTTDLINQFVQLPAIEATINLQGNLIGTLTDPQLQGEIAVLEPSLNGQNLLASLTGEFQYLDKQFSFETTGPEFLQIQAAIPYPTVPGVEEVAQLDLKLTKEAFSILEPITNGQLVWKAGEGEFNGQATLPIDWSQPLVLEQLFSKLTLKGALNLNQALISSANLGDYELNGTMVLDNQKLRAEEITLNFGESQLLATGVFPLITPLGANDPDVNNPLSLKIEPTNLNLNNLYNGKVAAQVNLTGTAFHPTIGGEIKLYQGQVFLPNQQQPEANPAEELQSIPAFASRQSSDTSTALPIRLNNLQVALDNISISQWSLYKFTFSGLLTLNGQLNQFRNIRADGDIHLERGEVVFLDTDFLLNPSYRNIIDFQPNQGLFNPNLDLQMQTNLSEAPERAGQAVLGDNEIRDDLFTLRGSRVDVYLTVKGRANQLIPGLTSEPAQACQNLTESQLPIPNTYQTPEQLNQLESCIHLGAIATASTQDRSLLESPVVNLTSSPPRSRGQIIELLAGQFLDLAENLGNQTGIELLQLGADQFFVGPLLRDTQFAAEQFVRRSGQRIGLNDLKVYPLLETVYRLDDRSSVRFSYDYIFQNAQVRYELGF